MNERKKEKLYEIIIDQKNDDQLMYVFSGTEVKPPPEIHCDLRFDTMKPLKGKQLRFC